ncbi:MAG: hypothetical protein ACLFQJ_04680 [Campylobacterales bacterium]
MRFVNEIAKNSFREQEYLFGEYDEDDYSYENEDYEDEEDDEDIEDDGFEVYDEDDVEEQ